MCIGSTHINNFTKHLNDSSLCCIELCMWGQSVSRVCLEPEVVLVKVTGGVCLIVITTADPIVWEELTCLIHVLSCNIQFINVCALLCILYFSVVYISYNTVGILWTAKEKFHWIIENMFLYCSYEDKHFVS